MEGSPPTVQTDGINFGGIWLHTDLIDIDQITTNDVSAVLHTYGVEAARATLMREVRSVFGAYGIGVDPRHLGLIADFMTHQVNKCWGCHVEVTVQLMGRADDPSCHDGNVWTQGCMSSVLWLSRACCGSPAAWQPDRRLDDLDGVGQLHVYNMYVAALLGSKVLDAAMQLR